MIRFFVVFFLFCFSPLSFADFYSSDTAASNACSAARSSYGGFCYQNRDSSSVWYFYLSNGAGSPYSYYVDSNVGKCPSPQVADSSGHCSLPPPPTCQQGYKVDSATNKCVPECDLRYSKDSSGNCVADVPPVAGSPVPSNGNGGGSLGQPGNVGWNDPSKRTSSHWGGGLGCIGGWEYKYAGGLCVDSGGDTSQLNCNNWDSYYTGNTCNQESSTTPGGGSGSVPGSTNGTSCDLGYVQGSITLNGVTSLTCTPVSSQGSGACGGVGQQSCAPVTCGGAGQPACNGQNTQTSGQSCGGPGQVACSVLIGDPGLGIPGLDPGVVSYNDQQAANRQAFLNGFATGGNENGLLSWAWMPELPAYSCSDPALFSGGHLLSFSGWCEKAGMIRDLMAYCLYLVTAFLLFRILTGSPGEA